MATQVTLNSGSIDSAGSLALKTNGTTTAVTIDTSQNVGIGTTSPVAKLSVDHAIALTGSGAAKPASLAYGMYLLNGIGTVLYSAASTAFYAGDTERLRIDTSGNLLVGTTSNPTTSTTAQAFRVGPVATGVQMILSGTETGSYAKISFNNGNGQVGTIQTSGSATSYNTSSDYRLKYDIAPMTGALARVAELKPVTYKWNADGSDGEGFIAHELQEVVPQCVTGEKDAVETYTDEEGNEQTRSVYQGIDTSFLVATLTAAIQELKTIVDAQAVEIAALKGTA